MAVTGEGMGARTASPDSGAAEPLLRVADLRVSFAAPAGRVEAVRGLSFTVGAGEAVALVGESGSGKTQTALAIMGLLERNARAEGSAFFEGMDVLGLPEARRNRLRGARMAMVFQDALSSLAPHLTVGTQLAEPLVLHRGLTHAQARTEAGALLEAVGIGDAARRLREYPHQLSGGMRQRVQIAMAVACRPRLLILDEPTTALDVTVQAQILGLLERLRAELGLALLLISHDLAVVAELCDRAVVMQAGIAVEEGALAGLLEAPRHPYTRALLESRRALAP
jgi:oligopeptide transport system ATP-binding protein